MKRKIAASLILTFLSVAPAFAYHPLNTEDPGIVEFRHYELEWGNYFVWPENSFKTAEGYVTIRTGVAPRLEIDLTPTFVYWMDLDGGSTTSGWGDLEGLIKYRALGDDGPFNLGVDLGAVFPSGQSRIGQGGEFIVPWTKIFGSVGAGKFRMFMDLGATFKPDADDVFMYGDAIEYSGIKNLVLSAELTGETDFESGDGDDLARVGGGVKWTASDRVAVSAGGHWGIAPDADRFYFTTAVVFGW